MVEARLKLGIRHEEHLLGQARIRLIRPCEDEEKTSTLTVTDSLDIVRNQPVAARANTIGIRLDTPPIEHIQPSGARQTVSIPCRSASGTQIRALNTQGPITEALGGTEATSTEDSLNRVTLGSVLKVLSESRFACIANTRGLSALHTSQLASRTVSRGRKEETSSTRSALGPIAPVNPAVTASAGPISVTLPVDAVASFGVGGSDLGCEATAGTSDTLVAFVASVWAGLALGAKVACCA